MVDMLRVTVTDLDGTLLDSVEVDREEFVNAQHSGMNARWLLERLSIGGGE